MTTFWFLPIVLGIDFLLFQHKHFGWLRKLLAKTKVTRFLAQCVFCRCFWISVVVSITIYQESNPINIFGYSISCGVLALVFNVFFCPCLRVWESKHR